MGKNIWIFNHYAKTPSQSGGTRHYDLAQHLTKKGYSVKIFASSFDYLSKEENLPDLDVYLNQNVNGIEFIWVKTHPYKRNDFNRMRNMYSYYHSLMKIYKNFEKPDVIIGSSVHPLACLAGYRIAKKLECRFISEIRDIWPQTLVDMGAISKNHPFAIGLKMLEKFIYKKSEKILVLLPGAIDYINNMGIPKDKIIYIPNGVDIEGFDNNLNKNVGDELVKSIFNEHKDKFKCLYAGAHGPANALDNIIHAAKIVKDKGYEDISFIFVGGGSEKEKLVKMAIEYDMNNIFFYNSIKKEAMPVLLKGVDLNLFNLIALDVFKYGLSSNKLFDYLCSSKPVVFSCKCLNDIVAESQCGISVEPEQPLKMSEAIITIYELTQSERNELGLRGRKYIEKNHSTDVLGEKLTKIL